MKNPILKFTGIFITAIFLVGAAYNVVLELAVFRKNDGTFWLNFLSCLALSAVFLASAFIERLAWLQPASFLAASVIPVSQDPRSLYGLGIFSMGVILLFRIGFFERRRAMKLLLLFAFHLACIAFSYVTHPERTISSVFGPIIFMLSFFIFLYLVYQGKIAVYLKEPKQKLSLAAKGLSPAEQTYALAMTGGKTMKEIAIDFELSESTVRNIMARAYKKLDVEDKSGLATLAERFEIVP